ncbi:hypothetical protein B4099_2785 [Heyndrickxia coagulans]|uniref:Uncharacterized protein n=1 Tax=Heyndrickxia coagulans TaxID=1398 RepID=A0A150KJ34_HEYCO|nr:hypothetical protein B4099_2785 [Heyndrickxia coagulans]
MEKILMPSFEITTTFVFVSLVIFYTVSGVWTPRLLLT